VRQGDKPDLLSFMIQSFGFVPIFIKTSLSSISTMPIFGVLFIILDQFLWRSSMIRKIGLVRVPDLNGTWVGAIKSSLDDYQIEIPASMRITQTWTKIRIHFDAKDASSYSNMCHISTSDPSECSITWEYLTRPKPNAPSRMVMHYGTCKLTGDISYDYNVQRLQGEYYTERNRSSYGEQWFERMKAQSTVCRLAAPGMATRTSLSGLY
jgi:hypothetical protein